MNPHSKKQNYICEQTYIGLDTNIYTVRLQKYSECEQVHIPYVPPPDTYSKFRFKYMMTLILEKNKEIQQLQEEIKMLKGTK